MTSSRVVFLAATISLVAACSSTDGAAACDPSSLTCGQVVSAAELTAILGAAPTYDEAGHPNCSFGGGGVQVFCASNYDSMLSGARTSYPTTTEPNTTGTKSFEVDVSAASSPIHVAVAEVGFVTTNGQYAVLVNLVDAAADIAKARAVADKVDQNLSAL